MKKIVLLISFFTLTTLNAQTKTSLRIGYIDMEYILENIPDYKETAHLLEEKAQKWKQEIEIKKSEINKLKENLKNENALLTKELIEERQSEIKLKEEQLLDYQQKRFGSRGDFTLQKESIIKPIQDQVFNTIQDLAEKKQYDFIFDKSSAQLTILFSAKKYDLSDHVIRIILRTEKRQELNNKQQKALEEKENKEDQIAENENLLERQKILAEKKSRREQIAEARKLETEQKKKAYEEKRKILLEEKNAQKNGTTIANTNPETTTDKTIKNTPQNIAIKKNTTDSIRQAKEKIRLESIEKNKQQIEEKRKAAEEKKRKIIEERETLKKAQQEKKSIN